MISSKVLLLAFVMFVSIEIALGGIECYQCSSINSGECGEGFDASKISKRFCSSYGALCSKRVTKAEGFTIRGCVTRPEICYEPEFSSCYTCDEDGCNLSSNVIPSFTVILSTISFIFVKYYL